MTKRQIVDLMNLTLTALIPVAIMVLATKPALRQAVKMKAFHMSKEFCQMNADFWQQLATTSAQAYQNARI